MLVGEHAGFNSLGTTQQQALYNYSTYVFDENNKPVGGVLIASPDGQKNGTDARGFVNIGGAVTDKRYTVLRSKTEGTSTKSIPPTIFKTTTYWVRLKPGVQEKTWGWIIPPDPTMASTMAIRTIRVCRPVTSQFIETVNLPSGGHDVQFKPGYGYCPTKMPPPPPKPPLTKPGSYPIAVRGYVRRATIKVVDQDGRPVSGARITASPTRRTGAPSPTRCSKLGIQSWWMITPALQAAIEGAKIKGFEVKAVPTGRIIAEGSKSQSNEKIWYACPPGVEPPPFTPGDLVVDRPTHPVVSADIIKQLQAKIAAQQAAQVKGLGSGAYGRPPVIPAVTTDTTGTATLIIKSYKGTIQPPLTLHVSGEGFHPVSVPLNPGPPEGSTEQTVRVERVGDRAVLLQERADGIGTGTWVAIGVGAAALVVGAIALLRK